MSIPMDAAVERLVESRQSHRAILPLSESLGAFTPEQAYAIQDAFRIELARRGQHSIGWKLAATGPTGQALFGVKEPISGFLFPETYGDGDAVSAGSFVALHAEAEIAFKIVKDLAGPGVTAATAVSAVGSAIAAIELPDMPFSSKPHITDVIANAALGKAIALAREAIPIQDVDFANEQIVFEHNGHIVSTNVATELMGDPLNALAWLANKLSLRGLMLKQGDIVMSGAISKLVRLQIGDTVTAKFTKLNSVGVTVVV